MESRKRGSARWNKKKRCVPPEEGEYTVSFLIWGQACKLLHSSIHATADASLGIRQSPRGLRLQLPTLGPSGRQERLNCWEEENGGKTLFSHFFYHFVCILSGKSILGQIEYLGRAETETQGIIQEKVMQCVRADQVFCLLADVAIFVCRYQFGANRSVHDIQQGGLDGSSIILSATHLTKCFTNVLGIER